MYGMFDTMLPINRKMSCMCQIQSLLKGRNRMTRIIGNGMREKYHIIEGGSTT